MSDVLSGPAGPFFYAGRGTVTLLFARGLFMRITRRIVPDIGLRLNSG